MKLRAINYDFVNPRGIIMPNDIIKFKRIKEPILIYRINNTPFNILVILGADSAENLIKIDNLPENTIAMRVQQGYSALGKKGSKVMVLSRGTVSVTMLIPNEVNIDDIKKKHTAAIKKICKAYGIEVFEEGNDLKFEQDGYKRKFCGMLTHKTPNGIIFWGVISFGIDTELMKQVYNFEHQKFSKKERPEEVHEYVGGLHDINPDINIVEAMEDIYKEFARSCGFEYIVSDFTEEEFSIMQQEIKLQEKEEWITKGNF